MQENFPVRKNMRLRGYDYSQNGAYFITICTQNKYHLFGHVGADSISARSAQMFINDAGKMIDSTLNEVFSELNSIILDKYIIMPNHVHMIVIISQDKKRADMESAHTVAEIVQSFKRYTTIKYIAGVKSGIYPAFDKRIWLRSYHDHIIRSEKGYLKICKYIDENPARWTEDCYYTL